ncbi:MAG: hypothetical protein QOJ02_1806 [Acidobacteriota bacterium]|jgi:hypothetical protein|nr:hypothetical protein [Acidobacteriota bacterium]
MRRLTFIVAMTLIATAAAYAQRSAPGDTVQGALRDPDPIHRDERMIALSQAGMANKVEQPGSLMVRRAPYGFPATTFNAQIVVTNHNSKIIKSISWVATLTDPNTGEMIGKYDITSETRISPGKKKKLKKSLPVPQFRVVSARTPRTVANLKSTITSVTFEDGATSSEP